MKTIQVNSDELLDSIRRIFTHQVRIPTYYIHTLITLLKEEAQSLNDTIETTIEFNQQNSYRIRRYHINRLIEYLDTTIKDRPIIDPLYIEACQEAMVDFAISKMVGENHEESNKNQQLTNM